MSSRALHVSRVRHVLLDLPPANAGSFEELIAHLMTVQFGRPFRTSASGTQNGYDGATVDDGPLLAFEAKRYSRGALNLNELRGKIAQASDNPTRPCCLWILVTTARTTTQLDRALRIDLARANTGYFAFDWCSGSRLPKLFSFLLIHKDPVIKWFKCFHPASADEIGLALGASDCYREDRADIEQLERDLAAITWNAETLIESLQHIKLTSKNESEIGENALEICLASIEFAKLASAKRFNQIPKQIMVLRSVITETATYCYRLGKIEEEDAVQLIRALDYQTSDFVNNWGDINEAPDLNGMIDGIRRKHANALDKLELMPSTPAVTDRRYLSLVEKYDTDFFEELEDIIRNLKILGDSIAAFGRPKFTRDTVAMLIYRLSIQIAVIPIDLSKISELINKIDIELDILQYDITDIGRHIIVRCRQAFGRLVKHRVLPDLTTFQLPGWAHEFILFDRAIPGVARQIFALSRLPISERNLEIIEPTGTAAPHESLLPGEPLSFANATYDALIERLVKLSEMVGLAIGLPAACHYQCLVDSSEYLSISTGITVERPVLTDADGWVEPTPRSVRLYMVPWVEHVYKPKPHDFDYYG